MDKFGIFKLLNSFYNFYQNNYSENNKAPEDNINKNPFPFPPKNPQNSTTEKPKNSTFLPLQSSMISTMNSHDAIVKRVTQKNKK